MLNRDLNQVLIIDASAESYAKHPRHGIQIKKYVSAEDPEQKDKELEKLVKFLQFLALTRAPDLAAEVANYEGQASSRAARRLAYGASPATSAPARAGHRRGVREEVRRAGRVGQAAHERLGSLGPNGADAVGPVALKEATQLVKCVRMCSCDAEPQRPLLRLWACRSQHTCAALRATRLELLARDSFSTN